MAHSNVQRCAFTLLLRKVAVRVQSMSLMIEMNATDDSETLPAALLSNASTQVPEIDIDNLARDGVSTMVIVVTPRALRR